MTAAPPVAHICAWRCKDGGLGIGLDGCQRYRYCAREVRDGPIGHGPIAGSFKLAHALCVEAPFIRRVLQKKRNSAGRPQGYLPILSSGRKLDPM